MNRKCSITLTFSALLAVIVLAGCYKPTDYPVVIEVPLLPVARPSVPRQIVGQSVQNRPIECLVLGQGPNVTFILAAIHGNEKAGVPLVRRLADYLQQHPQLLQGRKVVLLSAANPDGLIRGSRYNANGVDLNRNFSTTNRLKNETFGFTPLSEPETRIIHQLISQYGPDRIVSIHQPLACIDYDGPAIILARRMAQYSKLPLRKIGAKPGSLGSYAGLTLGIPIVTLEMLPEDSQLNSESLWKRYGTALVAAVVYPDSVK